MERVTLGRTGLEVSVAGLGCGGHSRLGQSYGHSFEQSVDVVRAAIDAGVNFIDTAAAYGTEEIVGMAVNNIREDVVISTKHAIVRPGSSPRGSEFLSGEEFIRGVEGNLTRLGTDYIDILHLHGIMPEQYDYCVTELLPVLERLREQGKIRFLGLTERFILDTRHEMLSRALQDPWWDVVMAGFNILNPSARTKLFAQTQSKGVGTLIMFAVRRALNSPANTAEVVRELISAGEIDASALDPNDPLGFLVDKGAANSVVEAAYRFCRHEPGADVILTGTGSVDHLQENLKSISGSRLPADKLAKLDAVFGKIDSVSGN